MSLKYRREQRLIKAINHLQQAVVELSELDPGAWKMKGYDFEEMVPPEYVFLPETVEAKTVEFHAKALVNTVDAIEAFKENL